MSLVEKKFFAGPKSTRTFWQT